MCKLFRLLRQARSAHVEEHIQDLKRDLPSCKKGWGMDMQSGDKSPSHPASGGIAFAVKEAGHLGLHGGKMWRVDRSQR